MTGDQSLLLLNLIPNVLDGGKLDMSKIEGMKLAYVHRLYS